MMSARAIHSLNLFAALAIAFTAAAQENPEAVLRRAVAAHQAGDIQTAIAQYQEFLRLRPGAAGVRSNLGAVLAATGRFEDAIAEYRIALKTFSADPHIHLNLGLALYKTGRIAEAVDEFAALHSAQPADRQVLLLLADCWLRQGLYANVIDLLAPLDRRDPNDLAVAYLLGTALMHNKQADRGGLILDRILKSGDSAPARFLMGTAKMNAMEASAGEAGRPSSSAQHAFHVSSCAPSLATNASAKGCATAW